MAYIEARNLVYKYENTRAINKLNLTIEKGEYVVVTGPNGCGKSTFALLLDALLIPEKGMLFVDGLDVGCAENTIEIRKKIGLVFQNPQNMFLCETVEEDVAFGPENLGLMPQEIEKRVVLSLKRTGMLDKRQCTISSLSGGNMQKVAISGVLALGSECIVLDESLSMLDEQSLTEVLETLSELNKSGCTIVVISHNPARIKDKCRIINFASLQEPNEPNV